MSAVGVVVIGRNEGGRLRRCFESLKPENVPVVYVDSGSTDGSVALALQNQLDVVSLDPAQPFSAARARNEGFQRCLAIDPRILFMMFVDGDCEVVPGWLNEARKTLEDRPELAVVCGRRRELHPEQSVYNRLADLEWDTPVGLARACGGDAMFRVSDFQSVGGFNPTAKAGEEPELCQRLREADRQIARIDVEMTRHDLNMTRFREWWRRQTRVGYHGLDIESRFQPRITTDRQRQSSLFGGGLRRARLWGIGWPLLVTIISGIIAVLFGLIPAVVSVLVGISLLIAQAGRLAWKIRRRVTRPGDALVHGLLMVLEKWANLAGQFQYLRDRNQGRRTRLIEYK